MAGLKEQPSKSLAGMSFGPRAFALVLDDTIPETWQFRLYDTPSDVPDNPSVKLTAAAARDLSNTKSQKLGLTAPQLEKLKAKVAAEWIQARRLDGQQVRLQDIPRNLRPRVQKDSPSGAHEHGVDRANGRVLYDGDHQHAFQLPNGAMVKTVLDGGHDHPVSENSATTSPSGDHDHMVILPNGLQLKTEMGGSHAHYLLEDRTMYDGSHAHKLILPGQEVLYSILPGDSKSEEKADLASGSLQAGGATPPAVGMGFTVRQTSAGQFAVVDPESGRVVSTHGNDQEEAFREAARRNGGITKLETVGVFIRLPADLAHGFPPKEEDASPPHITMLYVGDMDRAGFDHVTMCVNKVAQSITPFQVDMTDYGEFISYTGKNVCHMIPRAINASLEQVHMALRHELEKEGIEYRHYVDDPFKPHVTLKIIEPGEQYSGPKPAGKFLVDSIEVWGATGGDFGRKIIPLGGGVYKHEDVIDLIEKKIQERPGVSAHVSSDLLLEVYRRAERDYEDSSIVDLKKGAYAFSRVNKFLDLVHEGSPRDESYTTDFDLLPSSHPCAVNKKESFTPPTSAANAAKRGLRLRMEHNRGGTAVGVSRARDLSNRRPVSERTLARMVSFFSRHAMDSKAKGSEGSGYWGNDKNPSAGYIAWLLWGGDPGFVWAWKKLNRIRGGISSPKSSRLRSLLNKSEDSVVQEVSAEGLRLLLAKQDEDERTAFGIVLEPETVDSQSDIYSEQEICQAAWKFMEDKQQIGLMHRTMVHNVKVLESYVAPVDMEVHGMKIKKGTWLMRVRILDNVIWSQVKSGQLTGFSIGGSALRQKEESNG